MPGPGDGTENMDTTAPPTAGSSKRKYVDADGKTMGGASKRRVLGMSVDGKATATQFVWTLYGEFSKGFNILDQKDPFLSAAVMRQVVSAMTAYRQKINKMGEVAKNFKEIKFEHHNIPFSMSADDAFKIIKAAIKAIYKKEDFTGEDFGNYNTIMVLWNLFGERVNEARISPDYIIVDKNTQIKLKTLGIDAKFKHLCGGIGYGLTTRGGLAQSMGPLTIAVMLQRSTNEKYGKKWQMAFNRAFSHVPNHQIISDFLLTTPASGCLAVMAALAQLTNVIGARNQHRLAFPPGFLYTYFQNVDGSFAKNKVDQIDFSGKMGFFAYKQFQESKISLPKGLAIPASQVVFHAIMGTVGADFGVLKAITDCNKWYVRGHMNELLEYLKGSNKTYLSELQSPIKMKYYSKLASSTMTDLLPGGSEPIGADTVFAGYTKKKLNAKAFLGIGGTGAGEIAKDSTSIVSFIFGLIATVKATLGEDKEYDSGTVPWHPMTDEGFKDEPKEEEIVVTEVGMTFWHDIPKV